MSPQPLESANQQPLVPLPSPDKWGRLAAGRVFVCKNYVKLIMMRVSMDINKTRAFQRSDPQHDRPWWCEQWTTVPYQERIRRKKLAERRTKKEQQKMIKLVKVETQRWNLDETEYEIGTLDAEKKS